MKSFLLVAGTVLLLSLAASGAGTPVDARNEDGPSAEDAAKMLKSKPGTFVLSLEYVGKQDPKAPRKGFTLLATYDPKAYGKPDRFNLMTDTHRAPKVVDALLKAGFLDEATRTVVGEQTSTAKFDAPCYRLAVSGGGVLCEVNLGWGPALIDRLYALSAAFEWNDDSIAMGVSAVLQDLGDLRAAWAAETKKKLADDLDHFALFFYYAGPERKPSPSALFITTRPMIEGKRAMPHVDVVVTKEDALKVLDWLEKTRFFAPVQHQSDRTPTYPTYRLAVSGGGVKLFREIPFGPQVVWEAKEIKALLSPKAAEQAGKLVAELSESTKSPAERNKETLVANVKNFHFSIQHTGAKGDAKKPFQSMVLSTEPIEQLARPSAQFQVIIDEKQALKIVDFLWNDGFFWRAVQDVPKDATVSSYTIQVAAGGTRLEDDLGWGAPLVVRLEVIRAALDGEAASAMDKVIAPLREMVQAEEVQAAADRAKVAAALKAKLAGDLDHFVLSLNYAGKAQEKVLGSLDLSTHPMQYNARAEGSLDAVISKEEAAKVLDWLEKDGFFTQAEPELRSRPKNASYLMTVKGGGLELTEPIGWAGPLFAKLDALKTLVNAGAGKQIDKLAAPLKEIAADLGASRVKKMRDNLDKASFQFLVEGSQLQNAPRLRFVQGVFNAGEVNWTAVIDRKQIARIVDVLEKDGFFSRAVQEVGINTGRACVLTVGGIEWFQAELGWGEPAIARLKALRGALEGDAAAKMNTFIAQVKESIERPRPGPVLVSGAKMKKLNDERAEILRKNIDNFALSLRYAGQAEKPFYRIALHVSRDRVGGRQDDFALERVIDRQIAAALIDHLHDSGALGRAEARDPHAEMRFLRADPAGPCYELSLNGGVWLVLNLGWEKPMLDNLLGIRKCLDGDAADDMDTLLDRLSGYILLWTGKPYAPPK